jgi:acyl dehydratase
MSENAETIGGPFFEDLRVGQIIDTAPGLTLTEGLAAHHRAIVGDRLRLALDVELSRSVTRSILAHPALVWDVAIGQSTLVTQRVIANLFYRGLVFRRAPEIGDTLRTTTEVVALRQNRARTGRPNTGLAVLRIRTKDTRGREILDFHRCAMIPLRDPEGQTGHDAELEAITADTLSAPIRDWKLGAFRSAVSGPHFADLVPGTKWEIAGGDVVSSAPELARLTLNIAITHHDAAASSAGRLVYGGHTIGLAMAQASRALPNLVTVVGWHSCDHLAPVREGDTLRSTLEFEQGEPLRDGGGLVHLRSRVSADRDGEQHPVLDWRFIGVMA